MKIDFGKYAGVPIERLPLQYVDFINRRYGPVVDHARIRLKIPLSAAERFRLAETKSIAKQYLRRFPDNEPLADFIERIFEIFNLNP